MLGQGTWFTNLVAEIYRREGKDQSNWWSLDQKVCS